MSSGQRNVAAMLAIGFLAIIVVVTIGNAESMVSDFAAAGVRETRTHIWIWEVSSVVAWLSITPVIWWCVAHFRPPRMRWWAALAIAAAGLPLASAWHIAAMIGLRHVVYAVMGEQYSFTGNLADPYVYELRKDAATYLQFTGLAVLAQWLLARVDQPVPDLAASPGLPLERPMFAVTDGARRYLVPVDTIEHVTAAGNYVELHADGRVLTHRATLSGVERELGAEFVRIHRSRLVRRAAVQSVQTDRSGDFSVALASGASLGGSRRYRDLLLDHRL